MAGESQLRGLTLIVILLTMFVPTSIIAQDNTVNFQIIRTGFGLSQHKGMFMLPVTFSDEYNGEQTEAVFQVSAKHRLFGSRFYFAYTQISFWQAYDHNHSAPFRETNYNPEIFYRFKPLNFKSGSFGADLGFEHESNGQRPPVSRSWNLIYATPYFCTSNLLVHLKLRYRFKEDAKEFPDAFVGDDNPDITDYLGYTDLTVSYLIANKHTIDIMLRGNVSSFKGGVILTYSFPIPKSENSSFIIRASHGYGESLVDYKKSLNRIGVGVTFSK